MKGASHRVYITDVLLARALTKYIENPVEFLLTSVDVWSSYPPGTQKVPGSQTPLKGGNISAV